MLAKAEVKKASYSVNKSKAVVFAKRNIPFEVEMKLRNDRIPISTSNKLLEVVLDSKLNWHEHIEKQSATCKRLIFLLNRCCKVKWGLKKDVLDEIWTGCIEKLYCMVVRLGYRY